MLQHISNFNSPYLLTMLTVRFFRPSLLFMEGVKHMDCTKSLLKSTGMERKISQISVEDICQPLHPLNILFIVF